MSKYRFPYGGWDSPSDMQLCIDQLNRDCEYWSEAHRAAAERSVSERLELMAHDLGVILDELDDVDAVTVGEVRRLGVLARSVRDGAVQVVARTSLTRSVVAEDVTTWITYGSGNASAA